MGSPTLPTTYPGGDPAGDWTLAEYWAWDQEHFARRYLQRGTLAKYASSWRFWWGPALADVRLCDLTMAQIQGALDRAMDGREVVPSTAKSNVSILCAILGRARDNRAIDRNPAERVRTPRLQPTRPTALTPDELGRWLDTVLLPTGLGGFLWAGVLLAMAPLTGLRFGELRGLRWGNLDLWDRPEGDTGGMVHVVEQIDSTSRRTEWTPPKSASSYRHVPIPRSLVEVLEGHRERVRRQAARRGTRGWREHDLVFPSKKGYVIGVAHVFAARQKAGELAGLDPVPTFSCLRHTYATRLVEGGMSAAQVAKLLGHHDELLVTHYYFDPTPVTHDAAAAVLEGFVPGRRQRFGA